ncbi:MAG: mandelate racemase/muconate lactonizing enzyme family protein [Pirellulaceae bacterium]
MKITRLETILTNSGLRNYLFIRLTTDSGLTGLGEASLEWQEKTVETLVHEWVEDRILGVDPFDVEKVVGNLIRDQYQGGPTVLTAISGVEIAMWDLMGKACGQPLYRLLGGRAHDRILAYANGWYGNARSPQEYAELAREVVARGYVGLKFDPFETAWQHMSRGELGRAEQLVAAVREAVGSATEILIEGHGRLAVDCAIEFGRCIARYRPRFYEEPVTPHSLDLLKQVKDALPFPIAAGERLYALEDFQRFCALRAGDVLQPDICHIGGIHVAKKVAAMAQECDILVSPHVSVGPVALCAALHFDWSTPNVLMQENFSEYDVPWRNDLVGGWNPIRHGDFMLPDQPGLGIELDDAVCAAHPYRKNTFPSLWDAQWLTEFTQKDRSG